MAPIHAVTLCCVRDMTCSAILIPGIGGPAPPLKSLVDRLGPDIAPSVYVISPPPYDLEAELASFLAFASEHGIDDFHLYGHSVGATFALEICQRFPERLLSLTLSEPVWVSPDPSITAEEDAVQSALWDIAALPPGDRWAAYCRNLLADGVAAPRQRGQLADEKRNAVGMLSLLQESRRTVLKPQALRAFGRPVIYIYGGQSNPARFENAGNRLGAFFPDFTMVRFPDRSHFDPPQFTQADDLAGLLTAIWSG